MQPFDGVVVEHGPMVMRVCRALLGPDEADDAWSETFLSAMRAYPDLRPGSNVAGWLVTIAHHKAIDRLRARSRAPIAVGSAPDERRCAAPGPEPADNQLHDRLAALPPKQRGAVIYRYLADLPYAEVAARLDCSEPAARRSAADGIAALRRSWGVHQPPPTRREGT